jgi:hypothetical protein
MPQLKLIGMAGISSDSVFLFQLRGVIGTGGIGGVVRLLLSNEVAASSECVGCWGDAGLQILEPI